MTAQGTRRRSNGARELRDLLNANRRGTGLGIYSICSANRYVLEAGMMQASRDRAPLLIESTSNQVNQFGGYTGQTPGDFVKFIHEIARAMRFPSERIVLGGDHLGPHPWRNVTAALAMEKAREMVREYLLAGFTKIHLDASMPCQGDVVERDGQLSVDLVSARAAELCQAAEDAYRRLPRGASAPLYVIGNEVPVPGGEHSGARRLNVTRTKDLNRVLDITKKTFWSWGLQSAWERVIAVVVQPGVEFGDATVTPYDSGKARLLSRFLKANWSGVFEAHSTDYQTSAALRQMVKDHFAILKVGPALTFAFREAVFALEAIEREWLCARSGVSLSGLGETLERAMLENPVHWKNYYQGDENTLRFARKYSFSDRARYYWPQLEVLHALGKLIENLEMHPAPLGLLSQYLPLQAEAVRNRALANRPADLIRHRILAVIDQYSYACGMRS